jgi:hypothetical protein
MDNKIIVGITASILVGLISWNLKTTFDLSGEVIKLQQGQYVLEKQIKANTLFVKRQMRKLNKKKKKNK